MTRPDWQERLAAGYRIAAPALAARWARIESATLYAPIHGLWPARPGRALDVGAGPGRDAAWLAAAGWRVEAAEPLAVWRAYRSAATRPSAIAWHEAGLPSLAGVAGRFELVLVSAVWHHLPPSVRAAAMARLAGLTAPGGLLVLSLRHGPGCGERPAYATSPASTVSLARRCGLRVRRWRPAASRQAGNRVAGVTWTWLAFAPRRGRTGARLPVAAGAFNTPWARSRSAASAGGAARRCGALGPR